MSSKVKSIQPIYPALISDNLLFTLNVHKVIQIKLRIPLQFNDDRESTIPLTNCYFLGYIQLTFK